MARHIRVKRHLRNLPNKTDKAVEVEEHNRRLNDRNFLSNYQDFDSNMQSVFQRCPNPDCNFRNMFKINVKVPTTKMCQKCNTPIVMKYDK